MKKSISTLLWIIGIIVLCCIVLIPIFKPGFIVTDDADWMVIRLSAFFQSLRDGQVPVRFLGRLNFSYGYPVADFLYPGFLYIGSILHVLGFSFSGAVECILVLSVVVGAIAMFAWLRTFFTATASGIASLSFVVAPYLLYDVFKRGSVGEVLAIALAALSFAALEKKYQWLLAPSVALLSISHNTLALFFIPLLFGYIYIKKMWVSLPPLVLGIGMSLFFWLPALFDQRYVKFDSVIVSDPSHFFPDSHMIILWSSLFLIAACISLFIQKKAYIKEKTYLFVVMILAVFMASVLSFGVWHSAAVQRLVQFPFRFLSLLCITGPWFLAYCISCTKLRLSYVAGLIVVAILCVLSVQYQGKESIVRSEGFYTTNEGTTTVADEYMPRWVSVLPKQRPPQKIEVINGDADITEVKINSQSIVALIHAEEESILRVNIIYYPGWRAKLDNTQIPILYDNPYGVMQITIPAGTHPLIMVFRETPGRFIADIVAVVCFIMYAFGYVLLPSVRRMNRLGI